MPLHAIARCTPGVRPCAFVDGPFTEIDQEKSTPVAIVKEKIANDYWAGQILTRHAIGSTLDYMASIENSEVVFDYMEPAQAFSEEMRELVAERSERLEKIGERWASRFEPADMAAILRSHGFCDIEDTRSKFGHAVQGLALGYAGLHVVHAKH